MASVAGPVGSAARSAGGFRRAGGVAALLAGAAGLGYAVAFVIARSDAGSAAFLLLGGLLGVPVLVALYQLVGPAEPGVALCALALGLGGTLGSALHGGYDLANALHPPASTGDLPSAVDPRGLATFGLGGLALALFAWLIRAGGRLPVRLGAVGSLQAALLLVLWLGRLLVLDAHSPVIVLPALLAGFLVGPAWYLLLGRALLGARR
jgi:hypothetical protein